MKKIEIEIKEKKKSNVFIDINFEKIPEKIKEEGNKFLIISDENVFGLYGKKLEKIFSKKGIVHNFILRPGEKEKKLKNVEKILIFCTEKNFSRDDTIVSLGGGVVSDISGFVSFNRR